MDINLTKKEGIKLKTAGKYCQEDINVKPVLQNKTINANGIYSADNNYAGLGTVTVSISTATIKLQEKSATPKTTSQSITPDTDKGYNGLSKVTVNAIQTETKEIDANGTYTPTDGKFFSSVIVNVPTNIPSGYHDTSKVTADAATVLSPYKFVDKDGNLKEGVIPNKGAVSVTLDASSPSYTIPLGYHNGSGKVSVKMPPDYGGDIDVV